MLKILKEKSKLLNLFSYFLVFLITASSIVRAEYQELPEEKCRVQFNGPELEFEYAPCMVDNAQQGHQEFRILEGENIVVWTALSVAPPGLFYVYNKHKREVEKSLKLFGYINDNWVSISDASPPTMPSKINKKVKVYDVKISGLGACIGFLASVGTHGGGEYYQGVVTVLGCSNGSAMSETDIRNSLGEISLR